MRLLVALCVGLPVLAGAQEFDYSIHLLGKEVGNGKATYGVDGSFDSKANVDIAGQKIDSNLTVQASKGKIVSMSLVETAGTNSGTITWKDGKLSIIGNGKPMVKDKPVKLETQAMFTNFHAATAGLLYREFIAKGSPANVKALQPNGLVPVNLETSVSNTTVETVKGRLAVILLKVRIAGLEATYALDPEMHVLGFSVPVQQFKIVAKGYESVFVDPLTKYPELSQPTFKTKTESRIALKTRDGVILRSDIIRPEDSGKHPTILVRTPYGRSSMVMAYEWLARRGYVVVCQDVRGRGASDGEWDPLNKEVADGDDTLNWIAAQPWSDGGVGMIGGSYLGFVQWAAAVTKNPALKCIIPQVSPPDPMLNLPWDNGAFMLTPGLWWSRIVMERQANMAAAGQGIADFKPFKTLPVSQVDNKMFGRNIPFFDLWLRRPSIGDWKGSFRMNQIADVKIPVMHVSGTWDGDGIGTRLHYEALRAANGNQWLIFGPWEHGFNMKTKFGDQDYGPDSVLELDSVYLRFFDTHLKGKSVSLDEQPRVRFFVTGSNRWVETAVWPPAGSTAQKLYLSGGRANGKKSTGTLAVKAGTGKDTLIYNPMKSEVPPKGYEVDSEAAITTVSKSDLREADLLYVSEPFKDAKSITNVSADLFVSTTAKDTNFHVSIFDCRPDGKLTSICMNGNGTIASLGNGGKVVKPGQVYKITMKPWYFAHTFKKGHRLAFRVTSDLFPQFARNPGTGESIFTATKYIKATNMIYKSAKYPSSIRFDVLSL